MTRPDSHLNPSDRQRAWSRVRALTQASVLAATGLTALIGVVVAKEHSGASSATTTSGGSGTSAMTTTPSTSSSGESDDSGNSGNTGNTGSTSSSSPSITFSRPSVTSGGSSR